MIFVYDLIEELCLKNNITVTKLCKDCKIPRSTLSDYKKGRIKSLSMGTLCKIADYFSVSVDYICGSDSVDIPNDEIIKRALFGADFYVSDEIWNELRNYVDFIKDRENKKATN